MLLEIIGDSDAMKCIEEEGELSLQNGKKIRLMRGREACDWSKAYWNLCE